MSALHTAFATYVPLIEREIRSLLAPPSTRAARHYEVMEYHMGWRDPALAPTYAPGGKRIRPLLCIFSCLATGGTVDQALPAAAGLELLHNFSLIHDDIEDGSPTRRHRPTAWTLFGLPIALNVGDGMLSVAHMAFFRLPQRGVSPATTLAALHRFEETCLALTEGQCLDMSFEGRADVTVDDYYEMIAGKTGALLAAAPEIGAIVAGAGEETAHAFRDYGAALGLAFQLEDDILGIWGDEAETGKSAASDILSKKKSLPVLHALAHPQVGPDLQARYAGSISADQLPGILALLDRAGAREATEEAIREATARGHAALARVQTPGSAEYLALLSELLDSLVGRKA